MSIASLEDTGQAVTRVTQWLLVGEDPGMPVRVATSVAEIRDAKAAGDTAVVLHFQGSAPLRPATQLVRGRRPAWRPGHPVDEQLPACGTNFLRALTAIWAHEHTQSGMNETIRIHN